MELLSQESSRTESYRRDVRRRAIVVALGVVIACGLILLAWPVTSVLGAERPESYPCESMEAPSGTIVDESYENSPRSSTTLLPPELICSYTDPDGGRIIVHHDLGLGAMVSGTAMVGAGVIGLTYVLLRTAWTKQHRLS